MKTDSSPEPVVVNSSNEMDTREGLRNNLCLIEELLLNTSNGIELSEYAVAGLADHIARVHKIIV